VRAIGATRERFTALASTVRVHRIPSHDSQAIRESPPSRPGWVLDTANPKFGKEEYFAGHGLTGVLPARCHDVKRRGAFEAARKRLAQCIASPRRRGLRLPPSISIVLVNGERYLRIAAAADDFRVPARTEYIIIIFSLSVVIVPFAFQSDPGDCF